ncbi:hypothetical protein MTR67_031365 [Solanum verrucosum]|uniref:Uncharacterized protein n=1 Tax=Solanum verrucosum TaxID=315347 RepID=A0AAF0U2B0_SOLVR|nr:hypothetical protein MTR67_031365 [Solanum verrucosum]
MIRLRAHNSDPRGYVEGITLGFQRATFGSSSHEKVKIIQEGLKTAQSHQKSYTDGIRRDLEFEVDDWVYLKVSPMKGVMRFGKKGQLNP